MTLSPNEIIEIAELVDIVETGMPQNQMYFYKPYEKQKQFHADSRKYNQRCMGAGNQLGKTLAGSREAAFHATGYYPPWWEGQRFMKANVGWVGGVSGEVIRDTTQKLLVGRVQDDNQLGTGAIPHDKIKGIKRAMGVPGLLDHVLVKHMAGGHSIIFFKSYEKGREKFQGETIDWWWPDEEPPMDIYIEGLTRTNNGQLGQFAWMTFTPLKGMTDVVMQFYKEPTAQQSLTLMTIDDVDHYTQEEKDSIVASYPPHEREARSKGIPILGDGRVYPVSEDRITCDPFKIPKYWPLIKGLDFGMDHPFATVALAYDADTDTIYVIQADKQRDLVLSEQGLLINKFHKWIPVAWPHDGLNRDKKSGEKIADIFREDYDVNMLEDRSTFENGSNSVEAGLADILDRMRTGRFKVFSNLTEWFEEFRLYHRKDGKIVKLREDIMDATRTARMSLRHAVSQQENEYVPDDTDHRSTGYW